MSAAIAMAIEVAPFFLPHRRARVACLGRAAVRLPWSPRGATGGRRVIVICSLKHRLVFEVAPNKIAVVQGQQKVAAICADRLFGPRGLLSIFMAFGALSYERFLIAGRTATKIDMARPAKGRSSFYHSSESERLNSERRQTRDEWAA
jgi:hypothetical protein